MPAMNDSARAATTKRPPTLDDVDRELQDPDAWDWDHPVELTVSPDLTLTLGIRLKRDDLQILGAAAEAANMKLSDYIKRAAIAATRANLLTDKD
jgi:hypothetical protein